MPLILSKITKDTEIVTLLESLSRDINLERVDFLLIQEAINKVAAYRSQLMRYSKMSEYAEATIIIRELFKIRAAKWSKRGLKALDKQISNCVKDTRTSERRRLFNEVYLRALKAERQKLEIK